MFFFLLHTDETGNLCLYIGSGQLLAQRYCQILDASAFNERTMNGSGMVKEGSERDMLPMSLPFDLDAFFFFFSFEALKMFRLDLYL